MALQAPGRRLGPHDGSARAVARDAGGKILAVVDRTRAPARLERHDAEISLPARRRPLIESVLIPASPALYGERSDRRTLCVSTQVGCAYGCKFCASGLDGFTRNLTAGEIVEQILQAESISRERVDNLVFMGMGEPLANFANLLRAIRILNAGVGRRHRRAAHHDFHQRAGAADPQAGRVAASRSASPSRCTARPTRCATASCR